MSFYQSRNFTKTLCGPNILSELHICSFFLFVFIVILINHPAVFFFLTVNIILSELYHFFMTFLRSSQSTTAEKTSIVKLSQVIILLLNLFCRFPLNLICDNINITEFFWIYRRNWYCSALLFFYNRNQFYRFSLYFTIISNLYHLTIYKLQYK